MNGPDEIIDLAMKGEILKNLGRSGWSLAGVDSVRQESVGDHTFGTIFLSLMLSKFLLSQGEKLDLGKVLSMAAIHDLPESLTSDIPRTAVDLGGDSFQTGKAGAEKIFMQRLTEKSKTFGDWFTTLWMDIEGKKTLEARIVWGADMIDMLVHAISLETSGVSPEILDQFFVKSHDSVMQLGLKIVEQIFWMLYNKHFDYAIKRGVELKKITQT
ncbi:MAG: HD domain-containing protein [Candidatus Thorarchaeota archaeon]